MYNLVSSEASYSARQFNVAVSLIVVGVFLIGYVMGHFQALPLVWKFFGSIVQIFRVGESARRRSGELDAVLVTIDESVVAIKLVAAYVFSNHVFNFLQRS